VQLRQGRIDAAVQGGETLPYQNSVEENAYAPIGKPFLSQYNGIGMAKGSAAIECGTDASAQPADRGWHLSEDPREVGSAGTRGSKGADRCHN
jgi:polar amino acid transport system substrate-binding protein